jgi:hypothetical protein
MSKKPILNFKQFSGIFEDDVESATITEANKSMDIVLRIFFEIYGTIATRIGGYKDVTKDLKLVSDASTDKRGEVMVQAIDKISKLAFEKNSNFKEALDLYKKSVLELKNAYDKIIAEDKSQSIGISKRIKDSIITYLEYLIANVKNTALPKEEAEAKNESFQYLGEFLFEKKDLYVKERTSLIKSIIPLKSKSDELAFKSVFPEIKNKAKAHSKKYSGIIKSLQDDTYFEGKKKSERFKEIEDFRFKITEIENEMNSLLSSTIIKYGIKKEINDLVKKSLDTLVKANLKLKETEDSISKKLELSKEPEEEKEEVKKEETDKGESKKEYTDLKSGDKKEEVKETQKKINEIIPKDFKVDEDGDYGKKTEESLNKIVPLLKISGVLPDDFKLDTKKITPELQKAMDEYIKKLPELKKQLF